MPGTNNRRAGRIFLKVDGNGAVLNGMKEICAYVGKSEGTVLKYIRDEGLPAGKIGGEWVSDEVRINEWRLARMRQCK